MNTAMVMIDRLRDTSRSHSRCSVVEVMGRRCGDIALRTGIAVGATSILIPEIPFDFNKQVVEKINDGMKYGNTHFIVVVAEGVPNTNGVGSIDDIAKKIEEETGVESRATVLGHVQRGGSPTTRDRMLASCMGSYAVDLLTKGIGNRVVSIRNNVLVDDDIVEALEMKNTVDEHLYDIAYEISF